MPTSSSGSESSDVEGPPAKPDWLTDEDSAARSLVFLLSRQDGLSRENIKDALLDAVAHPVQDANPRGGRPRAAKVEAVKLWSFWRSLATSMPLYASAPSRGSCHSRLLCDGVLAWHHTGARHTRSGGVQ